MRQKRANNGNQKARVKPRLESRRNYKNSWWNFRVFHDAWKYCFHLWFDFCNKLLIMYRHVPLACDFWIFSLPSKATEKKIETFFSSQQISLHYLYGLKSLRKVCGIMKNCWKIAEKSRRKQQMNHSLRPLQIQEKQKFNYSRFRPQVVLLQYFTVEGLDVERPKFAVEIIKVYWK